MRECDIDSKDIGDRNMILSILISVNGSWSTWGSWSNCSTTCGDGVLTRLRTCTDPIPLNGGRDCPGLSSDTTLCNVVPCPIDGSWGVWSNWTSCSVSCSDGEQVRYRDCDDPAPMYGGMNCTGESRDNQTCFLKYCPS